MPAPAGRLTAPPRQLLTIYHAGQTWRLSDRPVDVTDRRGRTYHYRGGLPPLDNLYQEAPLSGVAPPSSSQVEVSGLPDLAELLALEHDPQEITAEVSQLREGDAWEQREKYVRGTVAIDGHAGRGEPLRLRITGWDPADSVQTWPPETARMDEETWGAESGAPPAGYWGYRDGSTWSWGAPPPPYVAKDGDEGRPYPWLFGRSGTTRVRGADVYVGASPVYPVYVDQYYDPTTGLPLAAPARGTPAGLIAGHPIPSQQVTIQDSDGGVATNYQVYWARDRLGRIVSVANRGAWPAQFQPADDPAGGTGTTAQLRCSLQGLGLTSYLGGPGISSAGELLRWALSIMGDVAVDWRRIAPAIHWLRSWRLAGFWDQELSPWSWLADQVLPLLPVGMVAGPDGLYPVVWRAWATKQDAVAHLEDGRNICLEGEVEYDGRDDIATSQVLQIAQGLLYGTRWQHRLRWRGDVWQRVGDSQALHLRRARLRYVDGLRGTVLTAGPRVARGEAAMIYDVPTGDLSLGWRSLLRSGPIRKLAGVGYTGRAMDHLVPGDPVLVTSSRLSLSRELVHVTRAGWRRGVPYVHLAQFPRSR